MVLSKQTPEPSDASPEASRANAPDRVTCAIQSFFVQSEMCLCGSNYFKHVKWYPAGVDFKDLCLTAEKCSSALHHGRQMDTHVSSCKADVQIRYLEEHLSMFMCSCVWARGGQSIHISIQWLMTMIIKNIIVMKRLYFGIRISISFQHILLLNCLEEPINNIVKLELICFFFFF